MSNEIRISLNSGKSAPEGFYKEANEIFDLLGKKLSVYDFSVGYNENEIIIYLYNESVNLDLKKINPKEYPIKLVITDRPSPLNCS